MRKFRVGFVEVKIYPLNSGRYMAAFRKLDGQRVRLERANMNLAEAAVREEISKHYSEDALDRQRAEKLLEPVGITVLEAVRSYLKTNAPALNSKKSLAEFVEEFISIKERDTGAKNVKDLKSKLRNQFLKAFPSSYLHEINHIEINRWLDSLKCGGRGRKNTLTAVITLFNYAKSQGYLPEGLTAAQKATKPIVPKPKKEIFTVEEMTTMIGNVSTELLPTLAIGAFAGVRPEEMCPMVWTEPALMWEDIVWEESLIFIREEVAKTEGRYIPIQPNLLAWLIPFKNLKGRVCPVKRVDRHFAKLGVKWRHNGLRHSYGTYRVAITKSVPQVALEMGNSVQMVKRHYQRPIPESVAKKWFEIYPVKKLTS